MGIRKKVNKLIGKNLMLYDKSRIAFADPEEEDDDEDCGDFGC
jgi:hypothetical protein